MSAYSAGPALRDALAVGDTLAGHRVSTTLSYNGTGDAPPEKIAAGYLATLDALRQQALPSRLSIKTSALHFDADWVQRVGARARDVGSPLHFDSLAYETADVTIDLARQITDVDIGITLPGRWKRSAIDVQVAVSRGYRVRVVKGQWPDPSEPDLDAAALALAGHLQVERRRS